MGVLKGNLASLQKHLKAIQALGKTGLKRVSRAVSEEAKTLVDEGFAQGVSPSGQRWRGLKVRQGQPLRDTRRLQSSLAPVDNGNGFRISTNLHYARVHQFGAIIKAKAARTLYSRKAKKFFGKVVKIHARPFLPREGKLPARWAQGLDEAARDVLNLILKP
jgi:phage gpG-like protein